MNFQEIFVILCVIVAVVFSVRSFVRQFSVKDGSCSNCSCQTDVKKAGQGSRNQIRYKKIKTF